MPEQSPDYITLLTSLGPRLTKRWTHTGLEAYDRAKHFTVEAHPLSNIHELHTLLSEIEREDQTCVIRGALRDGAEPAQNDNVFRRDLETFQEAAHNWVCLDVDAFEPVLSDPVREPWAAVEEFVKTQLPKEFHNATRHWQLSSSAGAPGKEGMLKAHIYFWLSEPRTGGELDYWARVNKLPVDITVFRTVQIHYTAAPLIDDGVKCPVTCRSGLMQFEGHDEVVLDMPDMLDALFERGPSDRQAMKNPRDKTGIIGAFCRAYDPRRAVEELLPDQFEFESEDNDVRLTWLQGGGTPGGACITDDELHVYNSHATDPFEGRACNTWDLVRVHLYGALDKDASDFELNSMQTTPSYVAMRALAKSLPDVMEEQVQAAVRRYEDEPPVSETAVIPPTTVADRQNIGTSETPAPADWTFEPHHADTAYGSRPTPAAKESPKETPVAVIPDRQLAIERVLNAIHRCDVPGDLETRLAANLRDGDWLDGERAQICTALQKRFKSLTNSTLPITDVRRWMKPITVTTGWVHATEEGRILGTRENVEVVLNRMQATVRYNNMSKEDEILIPGKGFTMDNRATASLGTVLSECNSVDMKIQIGTLKTFINMIAEENQYSPALTWIESSPWDGVDRMQAWFDSVTCPPEQAKLKELLMRRWAYQALAILHNVGGEMARAVLTFSGVQYSGKSKWIRALAPQGMVLTGHTLDVHDRDSIKKAISYWFVELGELDGTLRKSDLAALKAFISQTEDELRLPYAPASNKYPRRTCFAATVNETEFLRDATGNSRYWVLQVDAINAEHGIDMQQFWAQALLLWRNGDSSSPLPHWLTPEEMAGLNESNEDFTATDPLEELVQLRLGWRDPDAEWRWCTATQIATILGLKTASRSDLSRIGTVVRRANKNNAKKSNGVRLLWVPLSDALEDGENRVTGSA